MEVNETSHKPLYTVHSYPCASPVYDFGLEKACGYVSGNWDFANRICIGIAEDLIYNPYVERPHGLENYDTALTGACCCHAAIFSLLISHVTNSNPSLTYIWGGCENYTICFYLHCWKDPEDENVPAVKTMCSLQIEADANGMAAVNQHYVRHVMVPFNGTMYDPSYGSTGWPVFPEFAPGLLPFHLNYATRQTGTHLMYETLSGDLTGWYCPHSNCR